MTMKKPSSVRFPSIKLGLSGAFIYFSFMAQMYVVSLGSLVLAMILAMSVAKDGAKMVDHKPSGLAVQLTSAGVCLSILSLYLLIAGFLF